MPRFTYACPEHGEFQISLKMRQKTAECSRCKAESSPVIKQGSFQMLERLDNGLMPRRVERIHNIEEICEERSRKFSEPVGEDDDENS